MTAIFHDGQPRPTDVQIKQVERQLGLKFPASYRAALDFCNGATPEPDVFERDGATYGITNFFKIEEIPQQKKWLDEMSPSYRIPIADAVGGNMICIEAKGPNVGAIFFADHEIEGDEAFTFLAGSLEEFIKALRPDEPVDIEVSKEARKRSWIDPEFLKSINEAKKE